MLLSALDVLSAVRSVARVSTLLCTRSRLSPALLMALRVLAADWSSWSSTVLTCATSESCPVTRALRVALVEARLLSPLLSFGRAFVLMVLRALSVDCSVFCVASLSDCDAVVPAVTVSLMSRFRLFKSLMKPCRLSFCCWRRLSAAVPASVATPAWFRSVFSSVSSVMMVAFVSLTFWAASSAVWTEPFALVSAVPRAATVRLVCELACDSRLELVSSVVEDSDVKVLMLVCVVFSSCEVPVSPLPAWAASWVAVFKDARAADVFVGTCASVVSRSVMVWRMVARLLDVVLRSLAALPPAVDAWSSMVSAVLLTILTIALLTVDTKLLLICWSSVLAPVSVTLVATELAFSLT